jgi:hypothetical protein
MDKIPLHSIPALLEEVEQEIVNHQAISHDRLKRLLETKRTLLLALKEALEERDRLKSHHQHEYH